MVNSELSRSQLKEQVIRQAWESPLFKKKLFTNPQEALNEIGISLPQDIEVEVLEESKKKIVLVLPMNPLEAMNEFIAGSIPPGPPPSYPQTMIDCGEPKVLTRVDCKEPPGPKVLTQDCSTTNNCSLPPETCILQKP